MCEILVAVCLVPLYNRVSSHVEVAVALPLVNYRLNRSAIDSRGARGGP